MPRSIFLQERKIIGSSLKCLLIFPYNRFHFRRRFYCKIQAEAASRQCFDRIQVSMKGQGDGIINNIITVIPLVVPLSCKVIL